MAANARRTIRKKEGILQNIGKNAEFCVRQVFRNPGKSGYICTVYGRMPQEFIKTLYFCKAKRLFQNVSTQSARVNRENAIHLCPNICAGWAQAQGKTAHPTAAIGLQRDSERAYTGTGHGIPAPSCQACPTEYRQLFRCKSARTEKSLCAAFGDASNWPDAPSSGMGCSRFS